MAASSSHPVHLNADALPPQFPSGEAAVTHIKRFCFAASRRTCRLERAKSGGNCKLLVCASISNNSTSTTGDANECPWFVRVSRSRKPNERGWRVKGANLQHSERCLSASNTGNCVPDARTIAHALVAGSSSAAIESISTASDSRAVDAIATTIQNGGLRARAGCGSISITAVDTETPARVLREQIKTALNVDVKKRTLYRLKSKLLRIQDELSSASGAGIGSGSTGVVAGVSFYGSNTTSAAAEDRFAKSYQWIESLLSQFCELNPGSVAELQVDADNRFQCAIVVPKHFADAVATSESPLQRVVSIQTRPLIESNTSAGSEWGFAGVQVNLVARDGNCQELVVATAILREPDAESFQWVLEKLKTAGINPTDNGGAGGGDKALLVFCDRSSDSAFLRAIQEMNPSSSLSNLLFAPGDIIRYMLREKLISEVEKVYVLQAQAVQRIEDFRAVLDSLRVYRPQAASFLESLDPRVWAVYANLDRRLYGWTGASSSGAEDHQSRDDRQPQNPFECLYESMNVMMKDLFERSENVRMWSETSNSIDNSVMRVTPAAQRLLGRELSIIEDYDVRPCNPELVYVRHVSKAAEHRTRKVSFAAKTCTCAFHQQLGVPCRHIGAALKLVCKMERVYDFVDPSCTASSYAEAFGGKFIQIPLEEDLQLNLNHLPPDSSVASVGGDRLNKRKAQGQSTGVTRSYKCSNCGSTGGHNKKTCPLATPQ